MFADFDTNLLVFTVGVFVHTVGILGFICTSASNVFAEVRSLWLLTVYTIV